MVAWTTHPTPGAYEAEMVAEFETEHGRLPYANITRPSGKAQR